MAKKSIPCNKRIKTTLQKTKIRKITECKGFFERITQKDEKILRKEKNKKKLKIKKKRIKIKKSKKNNYCRQKKIKT